MPTNPQFAFIASTGRTATTLLTKVLSGLDKLTVLHEGHFLDDKKKPVIPPINMEHRKAWHDEHFSKQLVSNKRSKQVLLEVLENTHTQYLIDVAYYNAALVKDLAALHPAANIILIFRRCESFVRSATTLEGEDLMPVGWPDSNKAISSREKFIELGRLKPHKSWPIYEKWTDLSAIEKNIWLWKHTNQHLWDIFQSSNKEHIHVLHYEQLNSEPETFWGNLLKSLNLYNKHALTYCLEKSVKKENAKIGGYQIPAAHAWSDSEQAALQDAQQLEKLIYEHRYSQQNH